MIKKVKYLIFFLIFILLVNCSFDNKTGIWQGGEKEKRRISELEKQQKQILNVEKIYSLEIIENFVKYLQPKVINSYGKTEKTIPTLGNFEELSFLYDPKERVIKNNNPITNKINFFIPFCDSISISFKIHAF